MTTYVTAGENGIQVTVGSLTRPQLDAVAAAEAPSASNEFMTRSAFGDLAAEAGATSLEVAAARDAVPNNDAPDSLYDTINAIAQRVHRADLYTTLQLAINAAELTGGVLELAPGKAYTLASSLTIDAPITVRGNGASLTATGAMTQMIAVSGANVTIDGLVLDGGGLTAWGINVDGGGLVLRDSVIRDFTQQAAGASAVGVRVVDGTGRVLIDGCTFEAINGVSTGVPDYTSRAILIHNDDDTGFGPITIVHNHFKEVGPNLVGMDSDTIHLSGMLGLRAPLLIAHNYFEDFANRAIKLQGGGGRIHANEFYSTWNTGSGDEALDAVIDVQQTGQAIITDNVMRLGHAVYGIKVGSSGGAPKTLTIRGNQIEGTEGQGSGIGLVVPGTDRVTIADNIIQGFNRGIYIYDSDARSLTVHDNLISGTALDGIHVANNCTGLGGASFHDNKFNDVGRNGIFLEEGVYHLLSGNYAQATNGVGVHAAGTLIKTTSPATYRAVNNQGPGTDTEATTGNVLDIRGGVPLFFSSTQQNIAATATVNLTFDTLSGVLWPGDGSILGIAVYCSEALVSGTLQVRIRKNGSSSTSVKVDITTVGQTAGYTVIDRDTYTVAKGDRMSVAIESVSYNTTSGAGVVDVTVSLSGEYYLV
jgi:hypothetical protein